MTALREVAPAEKPDTAIVLERCAGLARVIHDLSFDLERSPQEFATALVAIRELAATIHDHLDLQIRRDGSPGIGYIDAVRAELDNWRGGVA